MNRLPVYSIRRTGVLFFFSILFLIADSRSAIARTQTLGEAIAGVVNAFRLQDSARMNRFVHPDYGVTVIFRRGVFDEFETVSKIDFEHPVPEYFLYPVLQGRTPLRFEALPVFDCEREAWSKKGLFCKPGYRDRLLSRTAINLNEYRGDAISPELIERFRMLEAKSVRIVWVDADGHDLVFYLVKKGGRWYLTVLDRVSSDCSA